MRQSYEDLRVVALAVVFRARVVVAFLVVDDAGRLFCSSSRIIESLLAVLVSSVTRLDKASMSFFVGTLRL